MVTSRDNSVFGVDSDPDRLAGMRTPANLRRPIRLAVLLQDLEFGGTQRYATHLLRHIDRELFEPELWSLRGGADMAPHLDGTGIPITWLSQTSWVGPHSLFNLVRMIRTRRPDILYTLTVVPNIWGRLFGHLAGVPSIVSGYRSLLPNQKERFLWRFSSRIICNAHVLKDIMIERIKVEPDRIAVVPNGVDTDFFRPEPRAGDPAPTAIYMGRLVDEKDPVNVLNGFKVAAGIVPEARFILMGNGNLRSRLERSIAADSLRDRIRVIPAESDIRSRLQQADIFAIGSKREASPNVVIEAMASGKPVVATAVGGIPELVQDGETGFLVEHGDSAGFGNALAKLLADPDLRRTMSEKARQRVMEDHSLETMVRRTEKVLLETVQDRETRD